MARPNITGALKAWRIYLKGNDTPLTDKVIFLTDHFLIVGEDKNDHAPTWYNIDQVTKIEGVEPIPPKREQRAAWI